ncbi:MAG: hypothetical protein ACI8TP_002808 [Acidimicrobiales bacterium]|jgi:hypothetical protein
MNTNRAGGLHLNKPWLPLTIEVINALPAQLGVYEIGDDAGTVLKIGFAGGTTAFGMRTALEAELDRANATQFRYEFTHGYLTRWEELLMVHNGEHGSLPVGNADHNKPLGRLAVQPLATQSPPTTPTTNEG